MKKTEHDLDLDAFDELDKSSDSLKQKMNQYYVQDEGGEDKKDEKDNATDDSTIDSNILSDVPSYQLKTILIGLVGLLLFFVLLSLFLFSDDDEEVIEAQQEELVLPDKSAIQPANTPAIVRDKNERVVKTFRLDSIDEIESFPAKETPKQSLTNQTSSSTDNKKNKSVAEISPVTQQQAQQKQIQKQAELPTPLIDGINPNTVIGLNKRQTIQINGRNFSKQLLLHLSWQKGKTKRNKSYSIQANPDQLVLKDSRHIELNINTGKEKSLWTVKIQQGEKFSSAMNFEVVPPFEAKPAKITENNKKQQAKSIQNGNKYALDAPAEHFAVQIMSASTSEQLNKIITRHKNIYPLYVVKSKRQGKNWYSLIYGNFSNKKSAQSSFKQLPSSLSKKKVWIRSYQSLQNQLTDSSETSTQKKQLKSSDIIKENPSNEKQKDQSVKSVSGALDEQKILSINTSRWSLQLLSSRSLQNIHAFSKKHQIEFSSLIYQQKDRLNQVNYILIYGVYASQADARNAIKTLSPGLQRVNPWVRSYMDIQQIIREQSKPEQN